MRNRSDKKDIYLRGLAEKILRHTAGKVLVVGENADLLVGELNRACRSAVGSVIEADFPYPDNAFELVVVTDGFVETADVVRDRVIAEIFRVARNQVLVVAGLATPPDRELKGRDWWERQCFERGFRKSSVYYRWIDYEGLNDETYPLLIPMEKMPSAAVQRYPLDFLNREIVLHMDMLRFPGRRSDAHCIRYQKAAEFIREGDFVVDVACGYGYGSKMLLENSLASKVLGIDLSVQSIEYATVNYGSDQLGFQVGDAGSLKDIPDNSVDFVAGFETIEHIPNPDAYLGELMRILCPGGRIMLSAPNLWVNEKGEDPNPNHLHVYSWDKLLNQIKDRGFLIERCFNEVAGGAMKCASSARLWREVPVGGAYPVESEWVIVVAMKDPLLGRDVPYVEKRWRIPENPAFNVSAFARDYLNPHLLRSMVTIGMRMSNPQELQRLQLRVLEDYPRESVDYGAALCGALYSEWSIGNGRMPVAELYGRVEDYCAVRDFAPHRLRWQVSCLYAAGLLAMKSGDLRLAETLWRRCLSYDVSVYSPLLGTKHMDAAFGVARILVDEGRKDEAKEILLQSVHEAEGLLRGDWLNVRGDPDAPLSFGYAESAQLLDKASRASYFLNALNRWTNRDGVMALESLGFAERTLERYRSVVHDLTEEVFSLRSRLEATNCYADKANREQAEEIFSLRSQLESTRYYADKANREQAEEIFSLRSRLGAESCPPANEFRAWRDALCAVDAQLDEFGRKLQFVLSSKAMRLAKILLLVRDSKNTGFKALLREIIRIARSVIKRRPLAPEYGLLADYRRFCLDMRGKYRDLLLTDPAWTRFDIVLQVDNFMVGGLENVMMNQAAYFAAAGKKTAILVLGYPGESVEMARGKGIPVVVFRYEDDRYRAFLAKAKPGVVFANCSYSGARICAEEGVPFVQVVHNTYVWTRTIPQSKQTILDSLPYTTASVCVSKQVADYFVSEYGADPKRTFVIPNGIELAKFKYDEDARREIRSRYGMRDCDTLFLAAASIGDQKNYPALIRAMAMTLQAFPTAKLLIIGHVYDQGIFDSIMSYIRERGLAESIIYVGCVGDVERYFSAADMLVHCSFYEGGPLTVIEGLATSLPFIATRTGCLLTLPDAFSGCTVIPPQIPLCELTSDRLLEQSLDFDKGLAARLIEVCRADRHVRVRLLDEVRRLFAREYAFDAYLRLWEFMTHHGSVDGFAEVLQDRFWTDYIEKHHSIGQTV